MTCSNCQHPVEGVECIVCGEPVGDTHDIVCPPCGETCDSEDGVPRGQTRAMIDISAANVPFISVRRAMESREDGGAMEDAA